MFWRREGGPLDMKDNSPIAWLLRIIAVVLVAAVVVMMFRLAAPSAAANEDVSDLPYALDAGWKGEKTCELLFENDDTRALRCTFPPGVGHERHWHPAHWGYVIEGGAFRITDETGVADRVFKAGHSWWSDGVKWHEAVNIGETTAQYLIVEPKNTAKENVED